MSINATDASATFFKMGRELTVMAMQKDLIAESRA